jgi:hypothetical protein
MHKVFNQTFKSRKTKQVLKIFNKTLKATRMLKVFNRVFKTPK